ncbi:acyl-CoA dehydrogenase [Hylemonella gracilis]|uniref:Acyl-CoA dehydrogenase n=1 Tax=Hylemonella gracilis TaxID=80880 RepID=A0A4P6UJR1_9BURK|nr:acyl-CoA dehydrogenase family protein [Hylemonella gracilis]QBK04806.1 acyl-CoA dehydrogenase [Hylemonella gracilis]
MDFNFTDDQEQLRDAVRKWVARGYNFERRRAIVKEGGFSGEAWGELAELGLMGLYIPEDDGGLGMGPIEGMVVMEELGRGIVLEPVAQSLIAGGLLAGYASADLKEGWLPGIASGERIVVLAQVERKARYRLEVCETTAAQTGGQWEINGLKSLVPVGDQADAYLVPAQAQGKIGLFLVERKTNGVTAQGYGTVDGSHAAEVSFRNAPAQLVTAEGLPALEHAVDIGIAALCAEAVGVMDQTLAATVDYMNTRKQFGVTLATFQALRHRVADMKMQLELARSMSYYASLRLNAPADERRRAIARAKVQLGQSMRFIGQQAVQLHGGIGVTEEFIVSHYFKKLTQLEMTYGDTLQALGAVSARMQDTAGVFA